jgi:hypothetical protein
MCSVVRAEHRVVGGGRFALAKGSLGSLGSARTQPPPAQTNTPPPRRHTHPPTPPLSRPAPRTELTRLGAVCIDGDKLAHKVYLPGQPAFDRLVTAFGLDIVAPSGDIDRRALGAKVFGNPEALQRLNAIVWPVLPDLVVEVRGALARLGAGGRLGVRGGGGGGPAPPPRVPLAPLQCRRLFNPAPPPPSPGFGPCSFQSLP